MIHAWTRRARATAFASCRSGPIQFARTFVDGTDLPHRHMAVDLGHDQRSLDVEVEGRASATIRPGHGRRASATCIPVRTPKALLSPAGGDGAGILAGHRTDDDRLASPVRVPLLLDALAKKAFRSMNSQRRPAASSSGCRLGCSMAGTYQEQLAVGSRATLPFVILRRPRPARLAGG